MLSIYKRWINRNFKETNKDKSRAQARQLKKKVKRCELCWVSGYLEVHHRDHNALNNKPNNLIKICLPCHIKQHEHESVANLMKKKKRYKQEVDRWPVIRFTKWLLNL